jgi:SAM-dependent MidA family methyltransferase
LQAVRAHQYADPYADVGENDLTAHVDFTLLANAARQEGLAVYGPVEQGAFLERLGIGPRAQALARAQPERMVELETARQRLVAPTEMGRLFKVLCATHPDWPRPEGFA